MDILARVMNAVENGNDAFCAKVRAMAADGNAEAARAVEWLDNEMANYNPPEWGDLESDAGY